MKISLAVALLLNYVGATKLETQVSKPLNDNSYLMKSSDAFHESCNFNIERMTGPSNSEETFKKANSGGDYWHDPSFPADHTSICWDHNKWGAD